MATQQQLHPDSELFQQRLVAATPDGRCGAHAILRCIQATARAYNEQAKLRPAHGQAGRFHGLTRQQANSLSGMFGVAELDASVDPYDSKNNQHIAHLAQFLNSIAEKNLGKEDIENFYARVNRRLRDRLRAGNHDELMTIASGLGIAQDGQALSLKALRDKIEAYIQKEGNHRWLTLRELELVAEEDNLFYLSSVTFDQATFASEKEARNELEKSAIQAKRDLFKKRQAEIQAGFIRSGRKFSIQLANQDNKHWVGVAPSVESAGYINQRYNQKQPKLHLPPPGRILRKKQGMQEFFAAMSASEGQVDFSKIMDALPDNNPFKPLLSFVFGFFKLIAGPEKIQLNHPSDDLGVKFLDLLEQFMKEKYQHDPRTQNAKFNEYMKAWNEAEASEHRDALRAGILSKLSKAMDRFGMKAEAQELSQDSVANLTEKLGQQASERLAQRQAAADAVRPRNHSQINLDNLNHGTLQQRLEKARFILKTKREAILNGYNRIANCKFNLKKREEELKISQEQLLSAQLQPQERLRLRQRVNILRSNNLGIQSIAAARRDLTNANNALNIETLQHEYEQALKIVEREENAFIRDNNNAEYHQQLQQTAVDLGLANNPANSSAQQQTLAHHILRFEQQKPRLSPELINRGNALLAEFQKQRATYQQDEEYLRLSRPENFQRAMTQKKEQIQAQQRAFEQATTDREREQATQWRLRLEQDLEALERKVAKARGLVDDPQYQNKCNERARFIEKTNAEFEKFFEANRREKVKQDIERTQTVST